MAFGFSGQKWVVTGLLCSMALVALSACSPGPGESATKSETSTTGGAIPEIKVEMGDFFYTPGEITLKSGKVKFTLTNVGATAHRFSIKTGDTVKWTSKNVGAGRDGILEVELPPGTYTMGCTLGDHERRGSVGKLTVE